MSSDLMEYVGYLANETGERTLISPPAVDAGSRWFEQVDGEPLPQQYDVPRCEDHSWLYVNQCAQCLGHELPDDVPVEMP